MNHDKHNIRSELYEFFISDMLFYLPFLLPLTIKGELLQTSIL